MKKIIFILTLCSLSACNESTDNTEKKGLGALVDRVKHAIGFSKNETASSLEKNENSALTEKDHPFDNTTSPELPQGKAEMNRPLGERIAEYKKFEEELFFNEDSDIVKIEDEASAKVDALMQDQRVQNLLRDNPDLAYEELPSDVYERMMAISEEEEQKINELMAATEEKLREKAMELRIEEDEVALDERKLDKEKRLAEIKGKVSNNS